MTYQFRPAVRGQTPLMLGIAGPSRSGKTYSALRIALGMTGGEIARVFVIDTESGRAQQYADRFGQFMHCDLGAPFTSDSYLKAIGDAHEAGAAVIVVDSMSHEHEGAGGILEQHAAELTRMAGENWDKRKRSNFAAWIKPKAAHNRFVNAVLQVNTHMIFCFRAKDKLVLVKNAKGELEPVSIGWQPICADRFEYEMTGMLVLPPGACGVPDLGAQAAGLREPLGTMIKQGEQLSEDVGKRLMAWASNSAAEPAAAARPATAAETVANGPFPEAVAAAEKGVEAFRAWYAKLDRAQRAPLAKELGYLEDVAKGADGTVNKDKSQMSSASAATRHELGKNPV